MLGFVSSYIQHTRTFRFKSAADKKAFEFETKMRPLKKRSFYKCFGLEQLCFFLFPYDKALRFNHNFDESNVPLAFIFSPAQPRTTTIATKTKN